MRRAMRRDLLAALVALTGVSADVYMQYPPGSNNRLDEGGGNRNNNNRLMDTQNNAKGGYGYGGDNNNQAAPVSYMVGSKVSMAWTSQHSCGSENAECQIVLQYMCNDANTAPPGGPYNAQAATGARSSPPRPDPPAAHAAETIKRTRGPSLTSRSFILSPFVCVRSHRCRQWPPPRRHERQHARPEQPAGEPRAARADRLLPGVRGPPAQQGAVHLRSECKQ